MAYKTLIQKTEYGYEFVRHNGKGKNILLLEMDNFMSYLARNYDLWGKVRNNDCDCIVMASHLGVPIDLHFDRWAASDLRRFLRVRSPDFEKEGDVYG